MAGNPGDKYIWLDAFRGISALLVCLEHARRFSVLPSSNLSETGFPGMVLEFFLNLGHESVIIFFVLSGFFITMSISNAFEAGRFTMTEYAIDRLSRLWMVLVPGLFLTLLFDRAGMAFSDGAFYRGELTDAFLQGPDPTDAGAQYTLKTMLGNLLFVHRILVPSFGTNGPLWSLTHEFWYYVAGPFFVITAFYGKLRSPVLFAAVVAIYLTFIPRPIALYGAIWCFGSLCYLASRVSRPDLAAVLKYALSFAAFAALLTMLILSRRVDWSRTLIDFMIAAAFSLTIWSLLVFKIRFVLPRNPVKLLAAFSFSLYVIHFPFIAFISSALLKNERFAYSSTTLALILAIASSSMLLAYAFYLLFERHTGRARRFVKGHFVKLGLVRQAAQRNR